LSESVTGRGGWRRAGRVAAALGLALTLAGCYKELTVEDTDTVGTFYDVNGDFASVRTYVLPDSVLHLGTGTNLTRTFDRSTLAILAANVAATALYGYSTKEFEGKTIGDLIPLEGLPRLLDELRSLSADAKPAPMRDLGPFRSRRKDGRSIDVEVSAGALALDGHDAAIALLTDVTERTLAETTLWESTEHLRRIVTSIPIVLWAVDRNGIFTLSEGHGLSALGLVPGEVVGRRCSSRKSA